MRSPYWFGFAVCMFSAMLGQTQNAQRPPQSPLAGHPGNVFLAGEPVVVRLPMTEPRSGWVLSDYEESNLATFDADPQGTPLGCLPVGFYRLRAPTGSNWVSCAVLSPVRVPAPRRSPIGLDVAMSWFYPREKMDAVSSLCALAGVNWVRDRLAWPELEGSPGHYSERGRYDDAAQAQHAAGLQILQVNHLSPPWANPTNSRFPLDLRDAYRFYKEMARRWEGKVQAFEPWNEADIPMFGGHTGAEMAALQKASFLGLKAGSRDGLACLNVFALPNPAQLADLHANEAWPYFETFNLHHYAPFDDYPKVYAAFRAVSAGRPLWVSECALPVRWSGDEQIKEPCDADLRLQAERVAKTFACSLHEGSANVFYFMLPHYVEGPTQFGLLRPDLTPRPGYVALAAVGRFLAHAKPLGRWEGTPASVRGYLFKTKLDGHARTLLVAWNNDGKTTLQLPQAPQRTWDHLGRPVETGKDLPLSSSPLFVELSTRCVQQMRIVLPPAPAPRLHGKASPVVFQALPAKEGISLSQSAYRVSSERPTRVPLWVYNFSTVRVKGRLVAEVPLGWRIRMPTRLEVPPESRVEAELEVDCRAGEPALLGTMRVEGDFGPTGRPVLSLRLLPEPSLLARQRGIPIPDCMDANRWEVSTSGPGTGRLSAQGDVLSMVAEPSGPDKWAYATFRLGPGHRPPAAAIGFSCRIAVEEGDGTFRALFQEGNESCYVTDLLPQPTSGGSKEVISLFEQGTHGAGWSKPDANGRLDAQDIVALKLGCNLKNGRVKLTFTNLRWLLPQPETASNSHANSP